MAIGETVLGAVLQVVFDRLASREVINFFHRSKFDQSLIEDLTTLMLTAGKVLLDAEEKQMTDKHVKLWLENLKHWFYRAEEVVDEIATEALQSYLEIEWPSEPQSMVTKVSNLASSSSFLNTVTRNIREIVTRLKRVLKQKDALGLRELSIRRAPQRMQTTSLLEDPKVYGRDQERTKLLEFLLSEEAERNSFDVVAIVGMGGLGKTTLAKMVYNDASVQKTFDLKAWVCVSDHFDIHRITKSLLESVTNELCSGSPDLNFLQNQLRSKLQNRKFVFILDDVWNEKYEDWQSLQAPLRAGANGSKIIVTTRNEMVASTMCTKPLFHMNLLSDDNACSLFSRHAFELGNLVSDPCLEDIGRKIVQKCKGLPLAIKTLGGLLRYTRDIKHWEEILNTSLWDLPYDKSNVISALWISYYHLPGHLKRCFSYCAIFPKDYKIDRKQLVLLWMAENLVPLTDNERVKDVGDDYLCQLLSRSFLEPVDRSYVTMHDLMHDLARGVSGKFLARHEPETPSKFSERARHFSYVGDWSDAFSKFQPLDETKHLRSFLRLYTAATANTLGAFTYLTKKVSTVLKPSLSCLRVLSLLGYSNLKLPELIECPRQLRYLDVSHTNIKLLPEWVCTLCNLQTLILSYCYRLERLPNDMRRMVSLRHLDIRGATSLSHMPEHMSKLTSLRTLTDFFVGENAGSGIQELRGLQHICGQFAIRGLENVIPSDAYVVDLSQRGLIDDLELEFNHRANDASSEKDRDVLESLEPPSNVERLTIRNYAWEAFPKWLDARCGDYKKMAFLCLSGCYSLSLPPLGELPSLKELKIENMDRILRVGHEFYGHNKCGQFRALESLSFENMKGWELWSNLDVEGNAVCFPSLEKLLLRNCPQLKGNLPIHTPFLNELEIHGCEKLDRLLPQLPLVYVLELASCPHAELECAFCVTSVSELRLEGLEQLVNLPPEVVMLSSLTNLVIAKCDNLRSLSHVQLPPTLKMLRIEECEALESLPQDMVSLIHLQCLRLYSCQSLRWIPSCSLPTSLRYLWVGLCERWKFPIPTESMHCYKYLESIDFWKAGSENLVSFPLGIFPNLHCLLLRECEGLEKVYIPEGVDDNSLTSLSSLNITECPKLEIVGKVTGSGEATVLPAPNLTNLSICECERVKPVLIEREGKILLPKLARLTIHDSNKITSESALSLRKSLPRFSSLTCLEIRHEEVGCFPGVDGWGCLPTSLKELCITDCPKLKKLDGNALQMLTSLQELYIIDCPKLESLPEGGLPLSLGELYIWGCPMVEERCQPEKGLDWSKIHHIPCVEINYHCISRDP